MSDPVDVSEELLDEQALRWLNRIAAIADDLEGCALKWKLGRDVLAELPMGGLAAAEEIDPTIDFAIPHAAVVMDVARSLRTLVAQGRQDFT